MKRFVTGLISGVVLLLVFAYAYLRLGYFPAAASAAPLPFEKKIASLSLKAHIDKEAPAKSDVPLTEDALIAGAQVYRDYCAMCHGIGAEPKTPAASGMYPPPPQLFAGKGE
jgi:mono/diheme cytochrome c family protein